MNPNSFIILYLLLILSCEKDDICLEGTPSTSRIIVLFLDNENPEDKKAVDKLLISGLIKKDTFKLFSGDSLAIPLRNNRDFTQLRFSLNTSSQTILFDSIQINHKQFDTYINRACGFKSTFILKDPFHYRLTQGIGWIKQIKKIRDTISDEESSHLAIYH